MDETAREGTPCPTCGKRGAERGESFPFCSARCRTIDLGGWLDERYRIPTVDGLAGDGEPTLS